MRKVISIQNIFKTLKLSKSIYISMNFCYVLQFQIDSWLIRAVYTQLLLCTLKGDQKWGLGYVQN